MKSKILEICAEKGFLLERELFDLLYNLNEKDALDVVSILIDLTKEKVITKKLYDENLNKFMRLFDGGKVDGVKILSDIDFKSSKIGVGDFVSYFRYRFEFLRRLLSERGFDNLSSIRRLGANSGVYTIIAMVLSKRITKSKNLLIEIEDLTGRSVVLVNRENKELFSRAQNLVLDDIVGFRVSGSSKMLFANDFVFPESRLESEKVGDIDEFVAFSGNFHVGSKLFLEDKVFKFVDWLNGEVGNERQRTIAKKVKYLFLVGNNIDGVGIYQGQEKFLKIKSCKAQYRKLEKILRKIRKDILIIMCPGQNDAVWLGEPQAAISDKWAPGLMGLENLFLVSNPCEVEIGSGFRVLMYHGASINGFMSEMPKLRGVKVSKVMEEILKRRQLAPIYGVMDYIPKKDKDDLVIKNVPDIFVVGDRHRAEVKSYNNILMVSTSCWQSITPFEERIGDKPDPCKVPLFNLKTREVKVMDFGGDGVVWEKGDDLVCKLEDFEK
jgi:DNA polymerase II small subunit